MAKITKEQIKDENFSNWDTAFGWGNHASAGYLMSSEIDTFAELDALVADEDLAKHGDNVSEFINDAGYLTSFTETDPIFTASPAGSITVGQISNWNTAFSWGDHSLAGYLTSTAFVELDDTTPVTTISDNGYRTGFTGFGETDPTELVHITGTESGSTGGFKTGYTYSDGSTSFIQSGGNNIATEIGLSPGDVEGNVLRTTQNSFTNRQLILTMGDFVNAGAQRNNSIMLGRFNLLGSDYAASFYEPLLDNETHFLGKFKAINGTDHAHLHVKTLGYENRTTPITGYGAEALVELNAESNNGTFYRNRVYISPHFLETLSAVKFSAYGSGTFVSAYNHTNPDTDVWGATTYIAGFDANGRITETDINTFLSDAPSDGVEYVRLNGAWAPSTSFGSEINDLTDTVTWANVPDANITESSVTQHESALSILWSQITSAPTFLTEENIDTLSELNNILTDATLINEAPNDSFLYLRGSLGWTPFSPALFPSLGEKAVTITWQYEEGSGLEADPSSGRLVFNNGNPNLATEFYISTFSHITAVSAQGKFKRLNIGDQILFTNTINNPPAGQEQWMLVTVTGITDNDTWWKIEFNRDDGNFIFGSNQITDINFIYNTNLTGYLQSGDNVSELVNDEGYINSTDGDWTGTLDGQEGSYYLDYNNFINTPSIPSSHTELSDIGINTHAQIDLHIGDSSIHYPQSAISITESQISDLQAYLLDAPSDGNEYVRLNGAWSISSSGGSVTNPGGSNTQIQFNNAGAFGGISEVTWDGTDFTFATNPKIENGLNAGLVIGTGNNSANSELQLEFRDRYGTGAGSDGQIGTYIRQVRGGSGAVYALHFGTNNGDLVGDATTKMILQADGKLTLNNVSNAGVNTDKILVHDASGNVDFRTAAQIASEIQGSVSITASQVSDFNSAVSLNSNVVANTAKISFPGFTDLLTDYGVTLLESVDLSYTASTRTISNTAGDDIVLPLVSSAEAGLAPASGGGSANFLRADGVWAVPSGGGGSAPSLSKSITIPNPSEDDDVTIFYTPVAISVSQLNSHISGGGLVTFNIQHAATRVGSTSDVFASDIQLASLSGQENNTGFDDETIPADSWVFVNIISVTGTPTVFHTTITYTED